MLLRKTLSIALISLLFVLEADAQSAGSFKISEVVVGNTNGLVDEYGNRPSWIEVANTSWGTVNLQNCYLTNNRKACRGYAGARKSEANVAHFARRFPHEVGSAGAHSLFCRRMY